MLHRLSLSWCVRGTLPMTSIITHLTLTYGDCRSRKRGMTFETDSNLWGLHSGIPIGIPYIVDRRRESPWRSSGLSRLCTTSTWLCIQFPLYASIMSFRVAVRRFCDRPLGSVEPITFLSLCPHSSLLVFFFFLFFLEEKNRKNSLQSWVPSATVTQNTGAKIFESNFIFRIPYIKMTVTTHSTRERKKKPQYRLRKWPWEVPTPQSWSPKCVERSHQRHIPKLQLCNFHLSFKPSDVDASVLEYYRPNPEDPLQVAEPSKGQKFFFRKREKSKAFSDTIKRNLYSSCSCIYSSIVKTWHSYQEYT
jgi:hypothetical protein